MNGNEASTSDNVKAGIHRLCADFSKIVAPLGFVRTNSRSREWNRQANCIVNVIHFHRSGSTYGAPRNNSVSIRVEFALKNSDGSPVRGALLTSDKIRDARGYAYHLRFNALTWSTYERCLEDLARVIHDHGLPWFEQNEA